MDKFFVNRMILPMLGYFQLFYAYFSFFKVISHYIIYNYLWLFLAIFKYFTLGYFDYFKLFLAILCFFYYFKLFHFRLLVILL